MGECKNCGHDMTEECFVNAKDIKFNKCHDCGDEEYPFKTCALLDGKTHVLLYPF